MSKPILILFGIVLVLGGVLAYVYFTQQEEISHPDTAVLSVSAEVDGEKVITGFKVNGEEFNTSNFGYTLVKVPLNYVITVENVNLPDQYFYKEITEINISETATRLDLNLVEIKNLTITKEDGKPINLIVSSEDYRDLRFCLKWSLSYIFVKSNYTEIDKPQGYERWDRCYKTDLSLKNSNITIPISYDELSFPKEKDFINISLFNPELKSKETTIKIK
jgi:hypothetical protein